MKKEVNLRQFQEEILNNWGLSVVQFYSRWSNTAEVMNEVFGELANMFSKDIKFYSLNVDTEPILKSEFVIKVLPKLVIFRYGEVIDEVSGFSAGNQLYGCLIAKLQMAMAVIYN